VEDWALIRRLVADGVPQRQVARQLGVGRSTVARAVASDVSPKYERKPVATSFSPFEPWVRALLAEFPELPAGPSEEQTARTNWLASQTSYGPLDGPAIARGMADQRKQEAAHAWPLKVTELVTGANTFDLITLVDVHP